MPYVVNTIKKLGGVCSNVVCKELFEESNAIDWLCERLNLLFFKINLEPRLRDHHCILKIKGVTWHNHIVLKLADGCFVAIVLLFLFFTSLLDFRNHVFLNHRRPKAVETKH